MLEQFLERKWSLPNLESMRKVRVSRVEAIKDTDIDVFKVHGDIHESKRVNVVFDVLHGFCIGPITLLRTGKILVMDHDPSAGGRGICLLEGGPPYSRCGGGEEKLHERGRDGSDDCIKKQLNLLEIESIIQIWGGRSSIEKSYHCLRTRL